MVVDDVQRRVNGKNCSDMDCIYTLSRKPFEAGFEIQEPHFWKLMSNAMQPCVFDTPGNSDTKSNMRVLFFYRRPSWPKSMLPSCSQLFPILEVPRQQCTWEYACMSECPEKEPNQVHFANQERCCLKRHVGGTHAVMIHALAKHCD
jgi:hypothetical protein